MADADTKETDNAMDCNAHGANDNLIKTEQLNEWMTQLRELEVSTLRVTQFFEREGLHIVNFRRKINEFMDFAKHLEMETAKVVEGKNATERIEDQSPTTLDLQEGANN